MVHSLLGYDGDAGIQYYVVATVDIAMICFSGEIYDAIFSLNYVPDYNLLIKVCAMLGWKNIAFIASICETLP